MSSYFAFHTSKPFESLELKLEDQTIILEKMNKETELYFYYPKMSYEDNKEYFYWISYDMFFNPCGYPDFFEWIEKELQRGNEVSLLYLANVETYDKIEERKQWEEFNSIYEKEYLKIKELIEDPDKLDFDYHIEFEFIL